MSIKMQVLSWIESCNASVLINNSKLAEHLSVSVANINNILCREKAKGNLKRLARGVYAKSGAVEPSNQQVATFKAWCFSKKVFSTDSKPDNCVYYTDGASSSFKRGDKEITLRRASKQRLRELAPHSAGACDLKPNASKATDQNLEPRSELSKRVRLLRTIKQALLKLHSIVLYCVQLMGRYDEADTSADLVKPGTSGKREYTCDLVETPLVKEPGTFGESIYSIATIATDAAARALTAKRTENLPAPARQISGRYCLASLVEKRGNRKSALCSLSGCHRAIRLGNKAAKL